MKYPIANIKLKTTALQTASLPLTFWDFYMEIHFWKQRNVCL